MIRLQLDTFSAPLTAEQESPLASCKSLLSRYWFILIVDVKSRPKQGGMGSAPASTNFMSKLSAVTFGETRGI